MESSYQQYLDYIKTLPLNDDPELFGLHDNANISCTQAETYVALETLLSLQPRDVGGASASVEEVTGNLAKDILAFLPDEFDLVEIQKS